jgi:outer membrane protein TolC
MAIFHIRKCCVALGIYLLLPSGSLLAQTYFSLQNLIDSATANIPLLKQKQALIKSSQASLAEVKHSFLPQVKFSEQLNAGSNNTVAGSYFTFGITPSSSAGVRDANNYSPVGGNIAVIYSEYELANFGLNKARLNYANANVAFQKTDLERELYSLKLEISRRYFNILRSQYRLDADKQNIDRYNSIFSIINALAKSGVIAGADSSLAKAELSRARINYNQADGKISQLIEELSYFTGIKAKKILLDTVFNNYIHVKPVSPLYIPDSIPNPLLNYYEQRKNILLSNVEVIKKSYLPKILLAGSAWARGSSIQYNDNFKAFSSGLGYQRLNYIVGVALTYNLFNTIYKKDRLAVNNYQLEAGEYDLQQQQALITSSIRQAENNLATTEANLSELPVQLQAAQAAFNQKMAQYKAGIISLIDVTNASFVLYRSQTDLIETLTDWYLAQLDKAAYSGNLLQYIQTIK